MNGNQVVKITASARFKNQKGYAISRGEFSLLKVQIFGFKYIKQ